MSKITKMKLWLVSYQMPFDLIVGIYKTEKQAQEKFDSIDNKYCPLIYPCPFNEIASQSGFRKYHLKTLREIK